MPDPLSKYGALKRHSFQLISQALADAIAASRAECLSAPNRQIAAERVTKALLAACSPIAAELAKANAGFDRDRFLAPILAAANEMATATNVIQTPPQKA